MGLSSPTQIHVNEKPIRNIEKGMLAPNQKLEHATPANLTSALRE